MVDTERPAAGTDPLASLAGGGEMGERIRAFDWSKTPLGPAESWSPALRMAVRLMLANRLPMLLWWGPQYVSVYNDPYIPVLGSKHPWGLGLPVSECWKEIWHVLKPLIDTPFRGGPATWDEDILLVINRHGFDEETHWLIAYSPVPDEGVPGGIGGVLATVHETTEKVLNQRRMTALRDLGSRPAEAKTPQAACVAAASTLEAHGEDIPFALLYLTDADGKQARLAATAGVATGQDFGPQLIDLDVEGGTWPLAEARRAMQPQVVADLGARFSSVPPGPWPDPPTAAVVLPLGTGKPHGPAGFLVAGASSRLRLDDAYLGFLGLVATQVGTAIANARAYEEERRRAEALAELDRAKTTFFSNVSHEFRTPLTLILGPLDDAIGDATERWQRDRLLTLQRNALRLQKLVNTLLDFARIEAGRVQVSFRPVDLAALTRELASSFESACEQAGLELVVDCPPLPGPVHVDAEMWEKVVLNLVSNAFKFTLKGRIEVTLRRSGPHAELAVRDTGVGIPADQVPRLFERFHRVEGVTGRTQEGSGIGLALVRELVRLHGGEVSAESVAGEGTSFVVTVPFGTAHLDGQRISPATALNSTALRAGHYAEEALRWLPDADHAGGESPAPVGSHEPEAGADLRANGERPRILLADDNADMRQYLQRLLAGHYRVEAVPDGRAAMDAVKRSRPDLILSDVMMPRLDGFGLLREIRADPQLCGLPVILLSARAGEESRVEGMRAVADDYLVKPFGASELLARVSAHLQMARLRREAGESLRAQREELREAQRVAHVGSWRWDAGTDVTTGSDELYRIYGLDPAAQAFPDFKDQDGLLYPHEEWLRLNEAVRETLRTGVGYRLDVRAFRSGEPIWITTRSEVVTSAGGGVVGLRGTVQDITERKRAEELLRRSEEHLRAVVGTTPACIKVVAADGTLLSMNSAGLAMVEAERPEDVQGGCVYGLVAAEYRDAFRQFNERVCRGEAGTLEFEIEGLRGTRRRLESHAAPLRGPDGRFRQLAITHDITDRKRAEAALRQSEGRFRAFVTASSDVVYRMSADWSEMRFLQGRDFIADTHEPNRSWLEKYIDPDDRPHVMHVIGEAVRTRSVFQLEHRVRRVDGTLGWTFSRAVPLLDTGGEIVEWLGAALDVTARKHAEEALQQERDRLRVTLASIGDAVITTDTEGRITFVNGVAESLTGWTNAEAVGQPLDAVLRIVNEDTRQPVENPALRALRDGVVVGLANHTVLIRKDGSERPIDDSAAPVRDGQGQVVGCVLVFRDVTERRQVENEARRNQELFRLVHQIGKIGHWEWNSLTDENRWSPEIQALYGVKPGTFDGTYEAWARLVHPDDLPRAEEDVRRALETGKYFTEFRVVWPDGSVHWLEARANVFKDGHDKAVRITGVNMDITERKRQEETLRRGEERWRTMAEALPNLVWTDLPDGQCDWLSSQWGKYTGIPEGELLGVNWLDRVIHPDDRERTLACWQAACADQGDYDLEYRIRRHDGEYHWFKTRGVPVRDGRGKITYWFGTCTDIEDVKRLEAALREADRRKDEFLATLAHELRNPLAPVRNALQILKMPRVDAQTVGRSVDMMERQVQHLVRLVDDLLDVSRVMRGKIELRRERVDLAAVVARAVETVQPLVDAQGHELSVRMSPDSLLLDADPVRLAQVVGNLLTNAAKYTEPGGRIRLTAERDGDMAVLRVRDNGIGIAPHMLPRIFELFVQVDHAATRSQGGLGIGLTLVKNLVEMHNGIVEARSEGLGHGSEFVVKLPLVVPAINGDHAPDGGRQGDQQPPPSGKRLLVVDDNQDAADSLAMLLRLQGHEVRVAYSGLAALEMTKTFTPDMVFMDIGMPGMDGYEAARRMRQMPGMGNTVMAALTGWGQQEDRRRTAEAGFDHHLVKPPEPKVVEGLLASLPRHN